MPLLLVLFKEKGFCHSILNDHQLEYCNLTRISAPQMLLAALIVIVTI